MGILKGRSGFLGRTRQSVTELRGFGQETTRAGLATLERLTRTPVATRSSSVCVLSAERFAAAMAGYAGSGVASRFPFSGTAPGVAALFLTTQDARALAELLLGVEKGSVKRLGELERSAIAETTNIALNASLNAISKQEGVGFRPEVPECVRGVADIDSFLRPQDQDHVVVVETPFHEESRGISGTMVLVFAVPV